MGYYISRQRYSIDNCLYVEIAIGGPSKSGPDKLPVRYTGENKNLVDPRDAVNNAEKIYKSWELDYADEKKQLKIVGIVNGANISTVYEFTTKGITSAKAWADKVFTSMEKCGACQKAMGSRDPYEVEDLPNQVFCTEYCCAKKYRDTFGVEPPRVYSAKIKKQMELMKKKP